MKNSIKNSWLSKWGIKIFESGIKYGPEMLSEAAEDFFSTLSSAAGLSAARERLYREISSHQFDIYSGETDLPDEIIFRIRDCARALKFMSKERSEKLADFSVAGALYDLSKGKPRPDLKEGFYAEMIHLFLGIHGKGPSPALGNMFLMQGLEGREAAVTRSNELDELWAAVEDKMRRYPNGLDKDVQERRRRNRERILSVLGSSEHDWLDWKWQMRNIIRTAEDLSRLISLSSEEVESINAAKEARLPFGITPYYVSLMDNNDEGCDRVIRAQVIPSMHYVQAMSEGRAENICEFDFMLERETSPIDLVTRRYPAVVILKPYNTCPQICVYCQRNWEINDVLSKGAMASKDDIRKAVDWLRDHRAVHDILVTGGDPLVLVDNKLKEILDQVAAVPSVERIRIGSRTPVTMPMRITPKLVKYLSSLRIPMKREVSIVTHVEHPYEITPEMYEAVERLRGARINVYNQNVYTFHVSRRFEAALLRRLLKRIGIEPYYTFNAKGKDETIDFRVPIARLLQEQKEEARMLPGLSRTDEAVFNVPGLGKNYLRAIQHRDVLSILPDGSRVYEFHPWEKNIRGQKTYVGTDVPILDYLKRLEARGEDISDYETIWYYY